MRGKNKCLKKIKLILSFFILLFISLISIDVSAKELNQTGFVDSFELTPREYWVFENGKLNVKLSEKKDNKLHSGDTLTLSVPENMSFTKFTSEKPLLLQEGGIVYGTAITNNDLSELIITFNDNVSNYSDFKGELNLTVRSGWVDTGEPNEIVFIDYQTNLGTNLPLIDYKIKNRKTIGSNPYFYKTNGSVYTSNPDYVYWWHNTNRNESPLTSDIEIKDRLHSGQKLVRKNDSEPYNATNIDEQFFYFTIYRTENNVTTLERVTPKEFVDRGMGTITFYDERSFDVFIKGSSLVSSYIVLNYQTEITPEGKFQTHFYNDAVATWNDPETGITQKREDLNKVAENLNNDATIAPDKGILRIMKLAKNGKEVELLPGATFKLFHKDGTPIDFIGDVPLTTDESGKVDTPFLNPGDYYVTEISAPNFVTFDKNKQYPFTISENSTKGVVLPISNDLKTIDIPVEKNGWIIKKVTL